MTITIHANGAERKRLVNTIAEWLDWPAQYKGAPSFAYEIKDITVDKNGCLHFEDGIDEEMLEQLMEHLYDEGFDIDMSAEDTSDDEEESLGICISMPRSLFTEASLENLNALIAAKGSLIQKALGTDSLPLEITDTKISFPWFNGTPSPDELKAYDTFICKLCEMARTQKRVTAKEKETDNEKYAFRCFLLRLGFIGSEYKNERKVLLRNLEGSSAFKTTKEVTE